MIILKGYQKDKIFKIVKFLFPLLLLIFAIFEIKKFVGNLDVHLLEKELNQLNFLTLLLIIGITFSAVLPMLLYDVILVRILGAKVPKKELLEQFHASMEADKKNHSPQERSWFERVKAFFDGH